MAVEIRKGWIGSYKFGSDRLRQSWLEAESSGGIRLVETRQLWYDTVQSGTYWLVPLSYGSRGEICSDQIRRVVARFGAFWQVMRKPIF